MAGEDVIGSAFVAIRPTGQQEFEQETLSTFKKIALGGAAIFGGIKLGQLLGDFITEARESVKVGAQTQAVLKSTGQVAGVTADQIGHLADVQSKKVGADDEMIQSGENLLLTFTKVRDQAGKGNDIFKQGTKVALDMSAALGQDLQSSIIQVGKALQDPISGVTALRRVGVQLDEQQKASIQTFISQNNLLGAQKVILKELATEFGGSAQAIATDADKFNVSFKNFEEAAGKQLLPILDGVLQLGTGVLTLVEDLGGLVTIGPALIATIGLIGAALTSSVGLGVFAGVAAAAAGLILLGNQLGIIGSKAVDTSDDVQKVADSILKANSALGAAQNFDAFNKNLDGIAKSMKSGELGNARFSKGFADSGVALGNFIRIANQSPAAAQLVIEGLKGQGRETGLYEQALASSIDRTKSSTAAKQAEAAQNRALLSTIEDLNDAVLKSSGTQAGYQQAVLDVAKAEEDRAKVFADSTSTDEDRQQATIRVTQAQLDAVNAAKALDDATDSLNETIGGSPAKIQAEIDKLRDAQARHPEVAASYQPIIDKLIDMKAKLDALPAEKPIHVFLEGVEVLQAQADEVKRQIEGIIGAGGVVTGVGSRASGGPVGAGTFLVGERGNGAELLTLEPGSRGFVTNAQQTAAMTGGDNYEINFYDHRGGTTQAAVEIVQRHRLAQALR